MSVATLLQQAAEVLTAREHLKEMLAKGLQEEGSKPYEVLPWTEPHQIDAVSAFGAILVAAGRPADDPEVLAAVVACNKVLEQRGITWSLEVWNDTDSVTKQDVVDLFQKAASFGT